VCSCMVYIKAQKCNLDKHHLVRGQVHGRKGFPGS
jgi:hypothetical protein